MVTAQLVCRPKSQTYGKVKKVRFSHVVDFARKVSNPEIHDYDDIVTIILTVRNPKKDWGKFKRIIYVRRLKSVVPLKAFGKRKLLSTKTENVGYDNAS